MDDLGVEVKRFGSRTGTHMVALFPWLSGCAGANPKIISKHMYGRMTVVPRGDRGRKIVALS